MQAPDQSPVPRVPRARLLWLTFAALLFAAVVFVALVLPAEFRIDPTGIGRLTGLTRLAGPSQVSATTTDTAGAPAARYYTDAYRSDFVDVPLASPDVAPENAELEYKVHMKAGATLVYSWNVPGFANPEEFYFDFHGEADRKGADGEAVVVEYLQTTGTHSSGMLVAPFDGIFGWYLQNQSAKPAVVNLKFAGFYELIKPGDYGNAAAIQPNVKHE